MDIERICRTYLNSRKEAEREANSGDVGYGRFLNMVRNAKHNGYLVSGSETLSLTLWIASILGDDVAAAQLRDLYEDAGMSKQADDVERILPGMRHVITTWTPATKKTFLRHCREKNVFRQRDIQGDSRAKKGPRTSAEPKPARSAV